MRERQKKLRNLWFKRLRRLRSRKLKKQKKLKNQKMSRSQKRPRSQK